MTKVIAAALYELRTNPLALAIVLGQILLVVFGAFTLSKVSDATARRDQLIERIIDRCK